MKPTVFSLCLFLLLLCCGSLGLPSPSTEDSNGAASIVTTTIVTEGSKVIVTSTPTQTTNNRHNGPTGTESAFPSTTSDDYTYYDDGDTRRSFNIYYITAVCLGIGVFILLVGAGFYRYRLRRNMLMYGDRQQAAASYGGAIPLTRNRQRRKKPRVVLSEQQFGLLETHVVATKREEDGDGGPDGSGDRAGMQGADHEAWKVPDVCAICIDDVNQGDRIVYLSCGHGFHVDCAKPWLTRKSTLCPLCKEDVLLGLGFDRPKLSDDDESDDDDDVAVEEDAAETRATAPAAATAAAPAADAGGETGHAAPSSVADAPETAPSSTVATLSPPPNAHIAH